MTDQDLRLLHLSEQNWEAAKECVADFSRISKTGIPSSQLDVILIKKACALVAAECIRRTVSEP